MLLNTSKDSSSFDFRLFGVYFLSNAGLQVKTGFTNQPNVVKPLVVPEEVIDTEEVKLPESEHKIPLEPVKEKIIRKDITPKIPKKLQIKQQRN